MNFVYGYLEKAGVSTIILILLVTYTWIHFLFWLIIKGGNSSSSNTFPVPSPPKLPIIGNLHQVNKSAVHRSLASLSERYGPIMYVYLGSVPTLVISSVELAREISKKHDSTFSNKATTKAVDVLFYGSGSVIFSPLNEYWKNVKTVCVLELLCSRKVESFRSVREAEVGEIVATLRDSCVNESTVDLSKVFALVSSNIVTRAVFGGAGRSSHIGSSDETFGELTRKALDLLSGFCVEDVFPRLRWIDILSGFSSELKDTSSKLNTFLDRVIDEHEAQKSTDHEQDFVDTLLDIQKQGRPEITLTRNHIKGIILDMLAGATDTSSTVMEWTMAELAKNPTVMKKAQEEVRAIVGINTERKMIEESDINRMDYLQCVIKEALRLHSPFVISRETNDDCTIAGYDIPSKTRVLINTWAIQRNIESWDRPKEFIPERFVDNPVDFKSLQPRFWPFGWGRRSCPGASFALIKVKYVIANLLYWFDWKMPDGLTEDDLDMDDVFRLVICKKTPLRLVPVLHTF